MQMKAAAMRPAPSARRSTDDAAWARLRPLLNVTSDAEFEALKAGYRDGIPPDVPVDMAGAAAFFALMARLGGEELVGSATGLPLGVFLDAGS